MSEDAAAQALEARAERAERELMEAKAKLDWWATDGISHVEARAQKAEAVVEAARVYFQELRAGRPALTIGIEQALAALDEQEQA